MATHETQLAGKPLLIHVAESEDDLEGFRDFIRANLRILACDSETTGLDIYSDEFRLRVVQFGNHEEAWVIPVERGGRYNADVIKALRGVQQLVFHNASFDLQVFDRHLGVRMEDLWPKITDTRILAHLVDPRGREEGGTGHGLEDLTRHYLDPDIADNVKGLMAVLAREHKVKKDEIWKVIDFNHPQYQLYAGMDTILTANLYRRLRPLVPAEAGTLVRYEHKLAEVCSSMERTGFLLDVDYTNDLSERLLEEELAYERQAVHMGCENIYSTEQVADVLEARGVVITGRTPTGKRKVDKKLLSDLCGSGDEFAVAVQRAKRARKWRTTWVDGFLQRVDKDDRCHAAINPLRARTARMSITGIPAQTLPAGDSMIRRCFLADPGHVIASVDYQTQELRVLAAISGDRKMQQAFRTNADLHQITADASGVDRKIGKMVNFAYVYGSGPRNIAEQGGITVETARNVIAGFEKSYPKVKQLSDKLQQFARRNGYVTTPFGRKLPVDPQRPYSALNYMVQSSSRDITAQALLRLHDKGFTPYLRLPIHDEVLLSVPTDKAEWGARRVGEIMATTFQGVYIGTGPEVGGRSWGSLYGADL
jgi:DNA polymerase-1